MANVKSFYITTYAGILMALLNTAAWSAPGKRSSEDPGKRIYLKQCAHCHGMLGEGDFEALYVTLDYYF